MRDNISTVGIPSVLWRLFSTVGVTTAVYVKENISTVGIPSLMLRLFSTVGDTFSTVEDIQHIGVYLQYRCRGITSVQWEITSVLWRLFSTVVDTFSTVGVSFSTMGDNSTVEVFSILKYYEFSKNLEIFSRAFFASQSDRPHHKPQLLTTADMIKDLGYKNLLLGKIPL